MPPYPRRIRVRTIDITGVMPEPPEMKTSVVRQRLGKRELARRLGQVDDRARLGLLDEVLADLAVRVGAQGDRDAVTAAGLRRADREAARRTTGALDLDAELDVLAGQVAVPGLGGLELDGGDGSAGLGLAGDRDDLGAHLLGGPHRVDQLQVAVDTVRRRERGDNGRPEDRGGDAHGCVLPFQ